MPSAAAKNVQFGFWVAAGFLVFGVLASIILTMSMWAVGSKK